MSVTTVLVPVLEPEAERLLEEPADARTGELILRAERLRARVARIDSIREDLHELLFARWAGARPPPSGLLAKVQRYLGPRKAPPAQVGYDPFVHLFGRSLPVLGKGSAEIAQRLQALLALEDGPFWEGLAADLRALDVRAAERVAQAPAVPVAGLQDAIRGETQAIASALGATPPNVRAAYDAVVRLQAWSWPVWRLDGELLTEMLHTLGATVLPDAASALFEPLVEKRPELEPLVKALPKQIGDFATAGGFLRSTDVKMLAGSLRLQKSRMTQNAMQSGESAAVLLRNLRLLEEAVFFCEAEDLGLAEAAGVEWHERGKR